jgi:hypothetical protein
MFFNFLKSRKHNGVTPTSYFSEKEFISLDANWAEQKTNDIMATLSKANLSRSDRSGISVSFSSLSRYYASRGTMKCFDSLHEGWYLIRKGFVYDYWAHKVTMRLSDFWDDDTRNQIGFLGNIDELQTTLAVGFILSPVEGFELFELVNKHIETQYISWQNDDFYSEFLFRLYWMLNKKSEWKSPIARPRRWWKHPYRNIFDHWNNETKLARDITEMLDYHIKWNRFHTRDHSAEFRSHFTMINPFELHVLEHVRQQLGLTTPKVDHVLTKSPLYPLPDFAKDISIDEIYAEDELLRKFVERNRDWCNRLDDDCDQQEQHDVEVIYGNESNCLPVAPNNNFKQELPHKKPQLRAYIFSMDKLREYYGSGDLSIIETLNIPSYSNTGDIDFKRGLVRFLQGQEAELGRPAYEYISAWEIICNHVGQDAQIEEFVNIGNIPAAMFGSFMLSVEIVPDINDTFVFFADFDMIQSIVNSISVQPMGNSPDEDTGLGLGLSFQLSGRIQHCQATNTNYQYNDQDMQNVVTGLTSLLIMAYKQEKDIIIFFDLNYAEATLKST